MVKSGSKRARNQRRWFAEASGWGLNLALGSADSRNKGRRSFPSGSDDQIDNSQTIVTTANFLHNTIYTANALSVITQGTDQMSRIGNAIYIKAIHGTFRFDPFGSVAPASGAYVRIMLVESTTATAVANFTSGLGSTDLFYGSTTMLTVARPDPRICNVICDELCKIAPRVSVAAGTGCLGEVMITNLGCVINKRFEYRAATGFGTASNFYWILIPDTSGGATGVTTVCSVHADLVVDFKII